MQPTLKNRSRFAAIIALASAIAAGALHPVHAQQAFPTKPIRLVIPFAPGGGAEVAFRPIVEAMTRTLGQQVLIDHRPGGGSVVASTFVKSALPDGYTIHSASNSTVSASLRKDSQFDILRDFTPIAPGNVVALMIAVNAEQVKATTVRALIEEVRSNPNKFNYASYGVGSSSHVFAELLAYEGKFKWTHIPFASSAQSVPEVAAGRAQVTMTPYQSMLSHVGPGGSGKIRVLAVTTAERSAQSPEYPGLREAGFPQVEYFTWSGYVGPAGMSREIVNRLNQTINAALKDPSTVEIYTKARITPVGGPPEELQRWIEREHSVYTRLIKETGLKIE
jgi:tripartite-type tricarboxylate transporter receptor subunit TctC